MADIEIATEIGLSREVRKAICLIIKASCCPCMKDYEVGQLMRNVITEANKAYQQDKAILAHLAMCLDGKHE